MKTTGAYYPIGFHTMFNIHTMFSVSVSHIHLLTIPCYVLCDNVCIAPILSIGHGRSLHQWTNRNITLLINIISLMLLMYAVLHELDRICAWLLSSPLEMPPFVIFVMKCNYYLHFMMYSVWIIQHSILIVCVSHCLQEPIQGGGPPSDHRLVTKANSMDQGLTPDTDPRSTHPSRHPALSKHTL